MERRLTIFVIPSDVVVRLRISEINSVDADHADFLADKEDMDMYAVVYIRANYGARFDMIRRWCILGMSRDVLEASLCLP